MAHFFNEEFPYDEEAAKKVFTPEGLANISKLRERLSQINSTNFTASCLENEFKTLAAATGQKVGALIHPARLAVSGRPVGPSLYHLLEVLGQPRVLSRLERAEKQFSPAH
jgi:glutamyl/glutaminyl-tRNA synthetase